VKPETRNQKPETRNQKPETRNQKPETRNQKELLDACEPRSGDISVAQRVSAGNEIAMKNKASRGAATSPWKKIAEPKSFVFDL
jgi:ribosomal protein L15E